MEKISLIFFIIVTITIIHLAESSSSGGGRSRTSGWSNYQARKRSFQPWHNRQTNPRRYPARQRSGDNSDYSDDSSSSGRRRLRPRPAYPYGQNGFPGRPPKIHNQPHDQHPFYQNNGKPNPRPNPQPNPFYQNNVHPNPDPHPFYENNPHPLPNSDPHPFYENNRQPKPRPDPNPFYQNNHHPNPDPFHPNNHQPQPNPIYGTGIPPQSHPNPTVQDPFYQNNMNPQPQDPNPFYENNVQPQPRPNPILGLVPQPTGQPLPTDNPFVTDLDLDPIFGPDPQPQLPPNGQGLPTDPNPFYTNNVQPQLQPNLQPGPPIGPTIVRSDLPDISPGPVLQQPYVPGVPPTPQAALDPNDFYEQNNPKPVVPSIPKGPRVIRVTSPKLYVGETDPDAFYDNNIIPGPTDPVPTGTKPPNPPILIRDDPVINPVFDRPLYAAGVDPDAEVTILTAQETTTTPTTTSTTTTARPTPPPPPMEIPPKESPDVMAPIPDITPLVAVQTPKLHTNPLHVNPTGNENNIQIPDIEPPKGVKNPVQYEDPLVPDEPISKAIKNPIIHNDMDQQEPIPDEKIPTAIKNPIVHNDMDQPKPIPDKPIPKAITNPIIHNDMDPRDRTPDEFIPVAIQNPIVYDDINKKDKIPDVVPPPTVANPKMYDDYTERVEPGTWEITQCYTGALVCPNNCEASTYMSGVRYCCPGCSGYKIHVENDVCKCLKRIDVFPSAFDDLNPDVINTQPDRGDVAYWTRGTGDDSASTNSNSGDVLEPLIGGTARLVGNELPTDIVFNPPGGNPTIGQAPIKRDPVLDDQILSSVFGEIAAPPTTTPINQVKLDEFIQSVYSNGNPFDINSGK